MAHPDGRAAPEVPMRAHLLPRAQPGLQEVRCVLADGPLRHSVCTNSKEGPKPSSGLLGTGYAGPHVVQWFSTGRPGPGWRGRLTPSSDGSLFRTWLPREQTVVLFPPGPASTVHRSIGHTWSVWGWTAWPASAVVSSKELPPSQGPPNLRACHFSEALPGRVKAKQPASLRPLQCGPTRVEWGRVVPGPGKPPPPPRRSGHPSAVACLFHPAHFPQQVRTTVPWGVPAGPGWQAPLCPTLRLHFGPAVSLPRRRPVPAGSRATALSSPSGGVQRTVRDRHAATPSPQQVRLPG
ncbi:hypothetical protein NDU88_002913 [Pleurodeles waltl]|uniref:Uncharacterized protein n=1 Tax=Pleurodeles waltl TaxID=8319 RepID=A0AAV7UB26_PLEWA|nr:hypothetical protein NDU88_002913 [Pleurodeles waltl]